MDYSIYSESKKMYSGAEKKIGIVINNKDYIVKFRKKTRFNIRNNHISEFLGCKIFEV